MTAGRLVLLATSPRVPPGLLSADGWSVLQGSPVLAGSESHPALPYLRAAGVQVEIPAPMPAGRLARFLVDRAVATGCVVWMVATDGDTELGHALPGVLAETRDAPELEVLPGSYDLPGARMLDLVAVMDRLRSPGGCPWDADQTHESLVPYLVEETYEVLEAVENGDSGHLREELGDLLLQVVFHARIAEEAGEGAWSVDDVAQGIVDKLVRRHPHVFADADAATAEDVERNWESLKAAEKGRTSSVDGVPMGMPALALTAKLMSRATAAGVDVPLPTDESVGSRLIRLVAEAQRSGIDAETELRAAARAYAALTRESEA
jgi:XTP/dITP diphosphohydrolase